MAGQRNSHGKRSHSQSDYAQDGGSKRRNPGKDTYLPEPDDTVYRYLSTGKAVGSIIGKGGEIAKQLRADTQSKIRIGETIPGCEDRIITIFSSTRKTNTFEDTGDLVSPAQDALLRVHDRLVADEAPADKDGDEGQQVTVRLLVPSNQIGCLIGKGGQIIQKLRSETGAEIRILKDEHLPDCALNTDELLKITGEASVVRKALYQISSRLHDNPSRSQHLLISAMANMHQSGGPFMDPNAGAVMVGIAPLLAPYGGYEGDSGGDMPQIFYPPPRDEALAKEWSLRLVCPTGNIGGVIGKGGSIIKQIRQESGASIKVDNKATGDDCIISISAKEFLEDPTSPTIEAALLLQPKCSEKAEKDSGISIITTRLLVPASHIGCLIGKGGAIISEMRRLTRANIRIHSKENLPKVALEDDEMVQISGELGVARKALIEIATRLKKNLFERVESPSVSPPPLSYVPLAYTDSTESRDHKSHGLEYSSYSGGYGGYNDLLRSESYGSYGGLQGDGVGSAYGSYKDYYSLGRSGDSGFSSQNPVSNRKHYGY